MRLWLAYQLLRLAVWALPNGTRQVIEFQINSAIDMGTDPARREEWLRLRSDAMREEGRDG